MFFESFYHILHSFLEKIQLFFLSQSIKVTDYMTSVYKFCVYPLYVPPGRLVNSSEDTELVGIIAVSLMILFTRFLFRAITKPI